MWNHVKCLDHMYRFQDELYCGILLWESLFFSTWVSCPFILSQFTYKADHYSFKLIPFFDMHRDLTVILEEPQGINRQHLA